MLKAVQNCNLFTWVPTTSEGQALKPRAFVKGMDNINAITMVEIQVGIFFCCWLCENALFSTTSMSTMYCQLRVTLFCASVTRRIYEVHGHFCMTLHTVVLQFLNVAERRMFTKNMQCRHLQKYFS